MIWRSAPTAFVALHENVGHIDLRIYQEMPPRTHDWATAVVDDAVTLQEEQQER